tara:strand:+ start:4519 stop:4740 length:222 start_codon:yes stop_codon:yes gene_type:complete
MYLTEETIFKYFKDVILQDIANHYEKDGIPDIPARREAFNNYTDSLCKDNLISEETYNTIDLPLHIETSEYWN